MARRANKKRPHATEKPTRDADFFSEESASPNTTVTDISRRKLWAFRIAAAVGIPLLLFVGFELILRIGGVGYDTSFLRKATHEGRAVHLENPRFGWRFFGPQLARLPGQLYLPQEKPKNTVRVFVFGESAAYGDPRPDFGLPRMLKTILSLRRPDLNFEVINAAMTGINSHAVREIARDCSAADGDIWVVYMGNNEVVGPFGAGTTFGTQTPPLALVRATLSLKASRTGQLLERLVPALQAGSSESKNWGGMQMFVKNQVRHDDPRMKRVYAHFRRNLPDILETGQQRGVGIVVSTVAVNLKDCAPFASENKSVLSTEEVAEWKRLFQDAVAASEGGRTAEAVAAYAKAAEIDDTSAELQFRWGQALLEHSNVPEARRHFELARDYDLLRFRCDSVLNSTIREVASNREQDRIRFVDAAEILNQASTPQISGCEMFYEHVHLTFDGNYRLAIALAEQVETLLCQKPAVDGFQASAWPSRQECADRLAWSDLSLHNSLTEILGRLNEPPFTSQLNHRQQIERVSTQLRSLTSAGQRNTLQTAAEQCDRATKNSPNDHVLFSQLAFLQSQLGDSEAAYQAAVQAQKLLPLHSSKWMQLGMVFASQQKWDEAAKAFEEGLALDGGDIFMRHELAKVLIRLDRKQEALRHLEQAVATNASYGPAYLTMAAIQQDAGKPAEADANFRQAIEHRVNRATDLAEVAQVALAKGWYQEAADCFLDALRLNPSEPALHLGAAQSHEALKNHGQAERHYVEVVNLAPNSAQAHYLLGIHYAKREDHARAVEQFGAAARLAPDFREANINYGMALLAAGRQREALDQFNQVLARFPGDKTAQEYKADLEKELNLPPLR